VEYGATGVTRGTEVTGVGVAGGGVTEEMGAAIGTVDAGIGVTGVGETDVGTAGTGVAVACVVACVIERYVAGGGTVITAEQTEQRARTPAAGTF